MMTKDNLVSIGQLIDQMLDKQLEPITTDIKIIKSDITKVKKDIKIMLSFFDLEDVKLRKRIGRIEQY
jgi:hypothetical protein